MNLLLIDDDPALLNAFSETISFHFPVIQVTAVASGEAAIEELARQEYDMVICDLMMPGMDGAMTLAKIRKDHPSLRTYLITGHPEPDKVYKSIQATGFFHKPLDRAYFLEFMQRTIRLLAIQKRVQSKVGDVTEFLSSVKTIRSNISQESN